MYLNLGRFSEEQMNGMLLTSCQMGEVSERVRFLSGQLLGIAYRESTLIGNRDIPEVLVVNLQGVDCFTFAEYVEAMRSSESLAVFFKNLKMVRYRSGIVSFQNRNHFFTDWREFNTNRVHDVTVGIGGAKAERIVKILNKKNDGTLFLQGILPVQRELTYIPSEAIDDSVLGKLTTGDYIGIYSETSGLDVSHVGIIIKNDTGVWIRHASAQEKYREVIDQDLEEYISRKPGIIVLRPKDI